MEEKYIREYNYWLLKTKTDEKTQKELEEIKDNENEIKERFYKDLEFGTGGLRGVLGAGTNRMNVYTVKRATQGMAEFIKRQGREKDGVVISYDCRHFSKEFAHSAASVLAANGIKAYVFDKMNPTPVLSFAVRYLKTYMGIMITASHNPKEYNGFKVYGADGAQLNVSDSNEIIKVINELDIFDDVSSLSEAETKKSNLIEIIGDEIVDEFVSVALSHQLSSGNKDIKIVYTPFHGTGLLPATKALSKAGYRDVYVVKEQAKEDPDFSTVKSPNPEDKEGFYLAIDLAKKEKADIIIGTDPDADRIGVLYNDGTGDFKALTGNQIGVLLLDYILSKKKEKNLLAKEDYAVSTIVTTDLARKIAISYGIKFHKVFTGFKFIAEIIKQNEESKKGKYILGFEESYGYLPGTYARDKDSITTALLICEMVAELKKQGKNIGAALDDIYSRFGCYTEQTLSVYMQGISGMEDMQKLMESVRKTPFEKIDDVAVVGFCDYKKGTRKDLLSNEETKIEMEKANVLIFELADGGFFAMRPSGTEPKIKFYYSVVSENNETGLKKIKHLDDFIRKTLNI